MRNIWKIFTTDIRRISNNVVAVVIIMGLSILPALYAWFNIFSNWDPYEPAATSQLKVAVASDDAGVLRTDLSEQFVTIARDYPQVKYPDFKKFVRNSIEYSFLQGESIWATKGDYSRAVPECSGCALGSEDATPKCKSFLELSEKARLQWKLEGDLAMFEKEIRQTAVH